MSFARGWDPVRDQFTSAYGRKVVSRGSAEELGAVSHLVVNGEQRRIISVKAAGVDELLVVGKRRKALLTFNPDTGALETILVGEDDNPSASLLRAGSFAVFLHLSIDGTHSAQPPSSKPARSSR